MFFLELRKGSHWVANLNIHLIFVTKYRVKVLTDKLLQNAEASFEVTGKSLDAKIIECNGEADHIHLLIEYPSRLSVSTIAKRLKGASSSYLQQQYPSLSNHWAVRKSGALWSPSYFVASVGGAPISVLKQYIQQQDRPH